MPDHTPDPDIRLTFRLLPATDYPEAQRLRRLLKYARRVCYLGCRNIESLPREEAPTKEERQEGG